MHISLHATSISEERCHKFENKEDARVYGKVCKMKMIKGNEINI